METPATSADAKPGAILDAAALWLSGELGWSWVKSRRSLEQRHGPQICELHLQPSVWSRTGVGTWVAPRVSLYDDRVRDWRAANPEVTVTLPQRHRHAALAFTTLLVNVNRAYVDVELSGLPQPFESASLEALRKALGTEVLPVLELFAAPVSLPDRLPQPWLETIDSRIVEWLLAMAGNDAAARLIRRYLEGATNSTSERSKRLRVFREGWSAATKRDGREQVRTNWLAELGWLSRVHALVDPVALNPHDCG
jgi:hypothetical protein